MSTLLHKLVEVVAGVGDQRFDGGIVEELEALVEDFELLEFFIEVGELLVADFLFIEILDVEDVDLEDIIEEQCHFVCVDLFEQFGHVGEEPDIAIDQELDEAPLPYLVAEVVVGQQQFLGAGELVEECEVGAFIEFLVEGCGE